MGLAKIYSVLKEVRIHKHAKFQAIPRMHPQKIAKKPYFDWFP